MQIRQLSKGMGEAVAKRTILRKKDNGELEIWSDVAHRVAVGNASLIKLREDPNNQKFIPGSFDEHIKIEQDILERHIANASLLMSGRHLQHGDEMQIIRNMEVFTNCSTATTSFILFYLLLNGSGVGRAYDNDMCVVDWSFLPALRVVLSTKHPDFEWGKDESLEEAQRKYKNAMFYTVEDSREGWAKALELLETMAYEKIYKDSLVILDFSEVRPKGAPIHGMQMRPSSGPKPTMHALENILSIKKTGLDPWEQAMWVDHYLAECVLVGGARRSARMSTKYWKD
jgi:ribonucleoside-triphosphate reductase (formate)